MRPWLLNEELDEEDIERYIQWEILEGLGDDFPFLPLSYREERGHMMIDLHFEHECEENW